MHDVVTIGEPMLRLSPPHHGRLRRARNLDLHVCGSQGNVAGNLARLGLATAFVTKVPDSALGLLVQDFYRSCGVDVTHVRTIPHSRLGVNFIEFGATPRPSTAVYDRRHSAASTIAPDDFDWDALLRGTRLAYTDGIFPALSDSCRASTKEFLAAARRQRCLIGFDVNYREHLWSPSQAAAVLSQVISDVDILLTSGGDAETVFGCQGSREEMARQLHERFGCRHICVVGGEIHSVLRGSIEAVLLHDGTLYRSARRDVDAVDRFGAGDALGSGVIYGVLAEKEMQYTVDFAAAMCAAAFTIPGDVAHLTVAEVEAMMQARGFHVRR
ncbi:MAG: PfkB family carbohydrate kinase [Pirellulaceae bacterium]